MVKITLKLSNRQVDEKKKYTYKRRKDNILKDVCAYIKI